ncbi:hypothetical protein SAMN02745723_10998 [Pragia fontium DSM 5563 = ATCC 49100]|uniref:Uncharacterized protein n=1 Tax=Pragia fontium DSM 5563 = ATCC 49100 TaxID=1122977 RepID=A0AAJ4WCD2_9GAMM|nr:hypothetical protein SAMN02745723_10998 [Pragia fontium DSM 5563 = ATCC 49100]
MAWNQAVKNRSKQCNAAQSIKCHELALSFALSIKRWNSADN